MRSLVVAIAIVAVIATTAKAADDSSPSQDKDKLSSIVGKLPDTEDSLHHVYLFTLKKNGISVRLNGDRFCGVMGYGEAVNYWEPVKAADVPNKCTEDGEVMKPCEIVKDGEIVRYIKRVKHGTYYKEVFLASRPKTIENQVEVPGDLDWVFCRPRIKR